MKVAALLFLIAPLMACVPNAEQQVFVDPISGQPSQMTKTSLNGWDAIQPTDTPANTFMLAKSGKMVVSVLDDRASRIILFGGKDGSEISAFGSTSTGHIKKISFLAENNELHILQEVNGKWVHSVHTSPSK